MYHIIVLTVFNENDANRIITANPVDDAKWLKVEIEAHDSSDVLKRMFITFKSAKDHDEVVRRYAAIYGLLDMDHGFINPTIRRAQFTEGGIMPMTETIGPDDEDWCDNTHEAFDEHDGFYRLSEYIKHCAV